MSKLFRRQKRKKKRQYRLEQYENLSKYEKQKLV